MSYIEAKEKYSQIGIDTDKAIEKLKNISLSMHCWQGDDVIGFDTVGELTGGIQTTGNYPGRAKTPEQLMADIEKALSLIPGTHKINLHACYPIFEEGEWVDRDALEPRHFKKWVDFAKKNGVGLDFNPTCFSHPKSTGMTLSHPDKEIRDFWIRHCVACIKIAEYFADELGQTTVMNIWVPDGLKDIPADRLAPRARLKDSLDKIFETQYDKKKVIITLESKVFGIGVESYTVGSSEFYISYSSKNNITPLMDSGHYHPTELISDKISSMLLFNDKVALHVSRPVRWDSDHVVLFDDETREIMKEIVRYDALDRVLIALDYFDASINRISAWTVGMRNVQKALLFALLSPNAQLAKLQDEGDFTSLMAIQEQIKTYPLGEVWDEFCKQNGAPLDTQWLEIVKTYEKDVLLKR